MGRKLVTRRKEWLFKIIRIILGFIFLASSIEKIIYPDIFASIVVKYQILPLWSVNALSIWLSYLEAVVGIMLILGLWEKASAILASGMCMLFLIFLSSALLRGIKLNCGCFFLETSTSSPRSWATLWQEALLLFSSILLGFKKR